jgi:cell division protease FtsH
MVTRYGMNKRLGNQVYGRREELIFLGKELGEHDKNYSEETAAAIDQEVNKVINERYQDAINILAKNKNRLDTIARTLLEKETIEGKDFEKLMDKINQIKPSPSGK